MNDIEKRAAEVVRHAYDTGPKYHTDHIVTALSAAGLLRTGLEQRAVEACEQVELSEHAPPDSPPPYWTRSEKKSHERAAAIGRESLAAKKPKWAVVATENLEIRWRVWSPQRMDEPMAGFALESDARDYCARKNAGQP